jgi:hypothetical protein
MAGHQFRVSDGRILPTSPSANRHGSAQARRPGFWRVFPSGKETHRLRQVPRRSGPHAYSPRSTSLTLTTPRGHCHQPHVEAYFLWMDHPKLLGAMLISLKVLSQVVRSTLLYIWFILCKTQSLNVVEACFICYGSKTSLQWNHNFAMFKYKQYIHKLLCCIWNKISLHGKHSLHVSETELLILKA